LGARSSRAIAQPRWTPLAQTLEDTLSMRCLTFNEFYEEAKPNLRKVFLKDEPTEQLFGDNAQVKKIIYEYWTPDEKIMDSITKVASKLGNTGFYFSITHRPTESDLSNPYHYASNHTYDWWIPFEEVSLFKSQDVSIFGSAYTLQNVIYSPHGKWGLMYSSDHFGILAGTREYIEPICENIPDIDRQVGEYIAYLKQCKINLSGYSFDVNWLPSLLERMYGIEVAKKLLEGTGLP
jgi:hypothetical protein